MGTPRTIRPVEPTEVEALIHVLRDAYPAVPMPRPEEWAARVLKQILEGGDELLAGAYEGDELVGALRIHEFDMCCFGTQVPCGGLGGVAVPLAHKKRGIARDMVRWYTEHCAARGDVVLALYPFRQDFYRDMGWGFGAPLSRYRVAPRAFRAAPRNGSGAAASPLRRLGPADREAVERLLRTCASRTHGMFQPSSRRLDTLTDPAQIRSFGHFEADRLTGVLCFDFEPAAPNDVLAHDLVVRFWCYETPSALAALMGFLHGQADQVKRVSIPTFDRWFHHALSNSESDGSRFIDNSREVASMALGIMWRLVDVERFFRALPERDWGGVDLVLGIATSGALGQSGTERCVVRFTAGRAEVLAADAPAEVELELLTADFASLALGVVPLGKLVEQGLARVSDASRVAVVERVFRSDVPPICDTQF